MASFLPVPSALPPPDTCTETILDVMLGSHLPSSKYIPVPSWRGSLDLRGEWSNATESRYLAGFRALRRGSGGSLLTSIISRSSSAL